jgi:hypothetical protein
MSGVIPLVANLFFGCYDGADLRKRRGAVRSVRRHTGQKFADLYRAGRVLVATDW